MVDIGWHVEGGNALSAGDARKQILMVVDNGDHASVSQTVDQSFNLVQIFVIVDAAGWLYGLPHHAQTDDIVAPVFQILKVLISDRHIKIESILSGEVRRKLDDNVLSMEDSGAVVLVTEGSSYGVRFDVVGKCLLASVGCEEAGKDEFGGVHIL